MRPGSQTALHSSDRETAAVDLHGRAGDVGGPVGGEEADDVAELARRADAPERDLGELRRGRPVGAVELGHARRVDPAGRDAVDGDAVRPELARERLRPAGDRRADRVREREVRRRLLHGRRGDADDAARLARSQVREAEAHEADGGQEQELERRLEALVGDLGGRAGRRAARVPDEHVDAAERLHGALDEPLEIRRIGHISSYGERAQPVRLALELVAAAREHGHVGALVGERFSRSEPEAGRSSADDRRPAAQTEIHCGGTVALCTGAGTGVRRSRSVKKWVTY